MRFARALALGGAIAGAAAASAHCSSQPTTVTVRSFERPGRLDVVCLQVADEASQVPLAPRPAPREQCAGVTPGTTSFYPFHAFGLVTQAGRGELAVVDLTKGEVVDQDKAAPGINFIPVGALPTDVSVSPDGLLSFVATAEPNKAAIFALPNAAILGNAYPKADNLPARLTLPALSACELPEPPLAVRVLSRTEGGAYDLVVVLRGGGGRGPKVVLVDPVPFWRGLLPGSAPAGTEVVQPGVLVPCPIRAAIGFSEVVPRTFAPGRVWDDGVPYAAPGRSIPLPDPPRGCLDTADAGALHDAEPSHDAGAPHDAGADGSEIPLSLGPLDAPRPAFAVVDEDTHMLFVADDALPVIHRFDLLLPDAPQELSPLLATSVRDPSRRVAVSAIALSPATHDLRRFLYAVDKSEGSIMVYDVTDPRSGLVTPMRRPHPELNPLLPVDRILFNVPVKAVEFARHDYPLSFQGTAQLTPPATGLLCNPNPLATGTRELDLGSEYRADKKVSDREVSPERLRGVFAFAVLSNGTVVTLDVDDWDAPCRRPDPMTSAMQASDLAAPPNEFPQSPLYPVQAFQGSLLASPVSLEPFFPVSVPHRLRSQNLFRKDLGATRIPNLVGTPQLVRENANQPTFGPEGVQFPLMLPTPPENLPPANNVPGLGITLRDPRWDPTYVDNPSEPDLQRRVLSVRQASAQDAGAQANGTFVPPTAPSPESPYFSMPSSGTVLPSADVAPRPGIRMAWEDPTVFVDQDWGIYYEGALPGFDGLVGRLRPLTTDYEALTLSVQGGLCTRGVEDHGRGQEKARQWTEEVANHHLVPALWKQGASGLDSDVAARTCHEKALASGITDYVQLIDDLLPPGDPYWLENQACWNGVLDAPEARESFCSSYFGRGDGRENNLNRDLPILEAYDDHLVLGRYYSQKDPQTVGSRVVVGRDKSNASVLRAAQCCFHNQAHFRVRAGGEWVATGSVTGYLHAMRVGPGGRCVASCDTEDRLLRGRAPEIPRPYDGAGNFLEGARPPGRNSPLALRNPQFSLLMWGGFLPLAKTGDAFSEASFGSCPGALPVQLERTRTPRDLSYRFSMRGGFVPQGIPLSRDTGSLLPESIRYVDVLGRLAVVDGASQGLVLIDLRSFDVRSFN